MHFCELLTLMSVNREILNRPIDLTPCPVESTVALIGGRWKPIILFHLVGRTLRYSELQRLVPGASDRMLSRALKELARDGLVHREAYAEVPVRVEYSLTASGQTLYPLLDAMSEWGERHWSRSA